MVPRLIRVGRGQCPVVIIDELAIDIGHLVALAQTMIPFPVDTKSYYPGLRRPIEDHERDAFDYVGTLLEAVAGVIGGGFDVDGFDLVGASFSMVTTPADRLIPAQRAPHFDSIDSKYLAILHYLSGVEGSGTAFYRQRATGIETVDASNVDRFVTVARRESAQLSGYTAGSNLFFEMIGSVEAQPGRLVIYPGNLLHSGLIAGGASLSDDPASGRLTTNIFIQAH